MPSQQEVAMEDRIINAPISAARRQKFFDEYVENRRKAGVLEACFHANSAFAESPEIVEQYQFGFRNMFPYKGPFVDNTNWLDMRSWEFAVAIERFLFSRFEELLTTLPLTKSSPDEWSLDGLVDALETMTAEAQTMTGRPPTLVAISDPDSTILKETYRSDRIDPAWKLPVEQRRIWLAGHYQGMPILRLPASDRRAAFVVDIQSFARLTKFDGITFELREISAARAAELLDTHNIQIELPEGVADTRESRMRQLRLRLEMNLWESFHLELLEHNSGVRVAIDSEPPSNPNE